MVTAQYSAKYILTADSLPVILEGKAAVGGITTTSGDFIPASSIDLIHTDVPAVHIANGGIDIMVPTSGIEVKTPVVANDLLCEVEGVPVYDFNPAIDTYGTTLLINDAQRIQAHSVTIVDRLSRLGGDAPQLLCDIYTHDPATGNLFLDGVERVRLRNAPAATLHTSVVLNTESPQYNDAGNWVGTQNGWPTFTVEQFKHMVGNGIPKLVERFSPEDARSQEQLAATLAQFSARYDAHKEDKTAP